MDYKLEYNKLRGEVYRLTKHIEELENSIFVETLVDKYESKLSRLTNKLDISNKNVTKYKEKNHTKFKPVYYKKIMIPSKTFY